MKTKRKTSRRLRPLSEAKQAELRKLWNDRLTQPLVFVPREMKESGLDPTQARRENVLLGKFATNYTKKVISRITRKLDIQRRLETCRKILAVGYGRGYDSKWLLKAVRAGLQTYWVDVSSVASLWATTDMQNQFRAIEHSTPSIQQDPQVLTLEIQSLLAEPARSGISLRSVEMWYLCRLLNCLPTKSAKIVLQEIGRVSFSRWNKSSRKNAVIIINALSDHNPVDDGCCGTSIRRSKKMILANLSLGAGRPVEARYEKHHDYLGKLVTAMTIMVKQ